MSFGAHIGDTVKFVWGENNSLEAVVRYVPSGPGDSWIVEDVDEGRIWYIQRFDTMLVVSREAKENGE